MSQENGRANGKMSSLILSPSPSTDSGVSEATSNDGLATTDEVCIYLLSSIGGDSIYLNMIFTPAVKGVVICLCTYTFKA